MRGRQSGVRRTLATVRIFALRDLRIAFTYRLSFVLGLASAFFSILTFFFITRVVGHDSAVGSPGEYFRFMVVGIAATNILRAAVVAAAGNARSDQVQGTLEILATQPISPIALALGWSALPVAEAVIEGFLMLAIAVPLGFSAAGADWASVLLVLGAASALFLAVGFIGAALVLAIQQGAGVMGMVVGVMALTGGTLFPTSVLPASLRPLTTISPLTYALRAMRGAMLDGKGPLVLLGGDLGVMLIYAAAALAVAVIALRSSLHFARLRGTLSRF